MMTGQYDACDQCNRVEEVIMSGGMSLCKACRATRCPACAQFRGVYWPELGRMVCQHCGKSYGREGD